MHIYLINVSSDIPWLLRPINRIYFDSSQQQEWLPNILLKGKHQVKFVLLWLCLINEMVYEMTFS